MVLGGERLAHAGAQADGAVALAPRLHGVARLGRGGQRLLRAGAVALPLVVVAAERVLVLEGARLVTALVLHHGHTVELRAAPVDRRTDRRTGRE